MKLNQRYIPYVLVLLILGGAIGLYFVLNALPQYVMLTGTVTAYNETPSYTDGGIRFAVDGKAVDIGGYLRPSNVMGSLYSPIRVGDKVEAKLLKTKESTLTIYNCSSCYVRKQ